MPLIRHYEEAKAYLYGLKHHGAKYGIDRMRLLADRIGHPERRFPIIHVAGTNGKGSTCAMIEAIFRRNGYKTGLFTSPHLVFQGERIQVNREILDPDSITNYTRKIKIFADELAKNDPDDHPSFFEFMTAMAFMQFAQQQVDIAIIETGLGGRLDATNIVQPEISVITSLSLDHTNLLGEDLTSIAGEKAGIIKEGRPVVLGMLPHEAENTIKAIARKRNAPVYTINEHFRNSSLQSFPVTNLHGDYQRRNAATALLVSRLLRDRFPVDERLSREALQQIDWPGRWDVHSVGNKTIILDTTHNQEGADLLAGNLEELISLTGRKPTIMVGVLGQERARAIMPVVARFADQIILLKPLQPRAASFQMLREAIPNGFVGHVRTSTVRTLFPFPGFCEEGQNGDTLVATGSLYLIGEIMETLYHEVPVREHLLQ